MKKAVRLGRVIPLTCGAAAYPNDPLVPHVTRMMSFSTGARVTMRAILSVYDKTGLVEFARGLAALGWELVSTGNTERTLAEAGIPVTGISAVTDFPEILGGRVKTLHPAVHGGILARRENADDVETLARHGITAVDMVVSNLYPFVQTVADPAVPVADALENIDIGGPTLVRAAAKNYPSVLVVTEPADYDRVLDLVRAGAVPTEERRALAAKAFAHVAAYDTTIASYLRGTDGADDAAFPAEFSVAGAMHQAMRYGENPHQAAALYRAYEPGRPARGLHRRDPTGGQGTLVQQHPRRRCGVDGGVRLPRLAAARLRDRQAQYPLRYRPRCGPGDGIPARLSPRTHSPPSAA